MQGEAHTPIEQWQGLTGLVLLPGTVFNFQGCPKFVALHQTKLCLPLNACKFRYLSIDIFSSRHAVHFSCKSETNVYILLFLLSLFCLFRTATVGIFTYRNRLQVTITKPPDKNIIDGIYLSTSSKANLPNLEISSNATQNFYNNALFPRR